MSRAWIIAAAGVCLALAGCATSQPPPDPKIVYRDVPVVVTASCAPNPPIARPAFADTDAAIKAAPNRVERARLYARGRLQREAYEQAVEAALAACAGEQ